MKRLLSHLIVCAICLAGCDSESLVVSDEYTVVGRDTTGVEVFSGRFVLEYTDLDEDHYPVIIQVDGSKDLDMEDRWSIKREYFARRELTGGIRADIQLLLGFGDQDDYIAIRGRYTSSCFGDFTGTMFYEGMFGSREIGTVDARHVR